MRTAFAVLILAAALALNVAAAFADDKASNRPQFYGDGFDYATCGDVSAGAQGCK